MPHDDLRNAGRRVLASAAPRAGGRKGQHIAIHSTEAIESLRDLSVPSTAVLMIGERRVHLSFEELMAAAAHFREALISDNAARDREPVGA